MKLIKMHGAGNDFLFVDVRKEEQLKELETVLGEMNRADWVIKVCDRKFGVGADGLAFLQSHQDYDFEWDFYNSDGSHAEMCGNAARCATLLYKSLSGNEESIQFLTASGPIGGTIEASGGITVNMGPVSTLKDRETYKSESGMEWSFTLLDTGVPHAVVTVGADASLGSEDHKIISREIRNSPEAGPRGTNVTWLKALSEDSIESVSYERGVEGFTLACGTGVVAAAYVQKESSGEEKVNVTVPGGKLKVDFTGNSPKLTGPAVFVANIELDENF